MALICRFRVSGRAPFADDRPTGDQTERGATVASGTTTERGATVAGGTTAERGAGAAAAGARAAAVFAGPETFGEDVGRPATTGGRPGRCGVARPTAGRGRVTAANIADPAQSVAEGGGERSVRPHAGPHGVSGDEPGRGLQAGGGGGGGGGKTERQLQAGERQQPAAGKVAAGRDHADGTAKGLQQPSSAQQHPR